MQTLDRKDAKPDANSRRALKASISVAQTESKREGTQKCPGPQEKIGGRDSKSAYPPGGRPASTSPGAQVLGNLFLGFAAFHDETTRRSSNRTTDVGCHWPPRGVRIARLFSSPDRYSCPERRSSTAATMPRPYLIMSAKPSTRLPTPITKPTTNTTV